MLSRSRPSRVIRRRRALTLTLIAVSALAIGSIALLGRGAVGGIGIAAPAPPPLQIVADGRTVATVDRDLLSSSEPAALAQVRQALTRQIPAADWVSAPRARVRYRNNRNATAQLAMGVSDTTATIPLVRRAVESSIAAPVLRQELRNNCESAALSILLAARGLRVSQLRIQGLLPRSGPLDPQGVAPNAVWGDPDKGFVGRPDGGGTAGGFGVYPGPIIAVARGLSARLDDLSGSSPQAIYRRLLTGRPVIAWVGLSDGPTGSWQSPTGQPITVNFGEHTVVLRGIDSDGSLKVSNPLRGTAETWTRAQFESMYELLGRRAVGA